MKHLKSTRLDTWERRVALVGSLSSIILFVVYLIDTGRL